MLFRGRRWASFFPSRESVAAGAPFIAALLAPAATLFDIPALSQRWYSFNGSQIADPSASLILSAVSLAFSVMANALLVVRFTIENPHRWRIAIFISTFGWVMKTLIGLANLIVFGATRRNGAGYQYLEGFWCAILSVILSGFVMILLTAHYLSNRRDRPEGSVNLDCRMLIISEMILFAVMALEALIFSKVEGWTYLDGLYFSVVSLLTIGFGNFAPTKASTKVLLFPFSILGIALLSNQVTLITSVSSRLTARYRQQLNYGPKLHMKLTRQLTFLGAKVDGLRGSTSPEQQAMQDNERDHDLLREVKRLRRMHTLQEGADEMFAFLFSLLLLVVFWFVSGAIFQAIEGWTFGDAMYFSYIFFLTIGYGDFAPNTPAGKTVFVFWAMLAVPIMTNFVVQTIQTIVSRSSTLISNRARERRSQWYDYLATYFVPHSDLVDQVRQNIDDTTSKEQAKEEGESASDSDKNSSTEATSTTTTTTKRAEKAVRRVDTEEKAASHEEDGEMITVSKAALLATLEQSIRLEAECREMLIDQLRTGSAPWLLLKADSNLRKLQRLENSMKAAAADEQDPSSTSNKAARKRRRGKERATEEQKDVNDEFGALSKEDVIDRVGAYRQTYARFLVLAGRLTEMDDCGLFDWEREVEAQAAESILDSH